MEDNTVTVQEKIRPISVNEEMKSSYLDYSMSVIVGRALPDVRDGLKPCHRRILFAMKELGMYHNKAYKKCARVVGEVLGKYHPHGDTAVYDTLVRMVQDFSLRYPLLDGQGNFGSIDGDNAAAMRYTETRMQSISESMLADLEKDTIDFKPNFDETLTEPVVLPSKIPNLLVNGSSGIAVGMATNIPPHNLNEVVEATKMLIDDPTASIEDLMTILKGPDFPTGGIIQGVSEIRRMYKTGKGLIRVRGVCEVEEVRPGKDAIVIKEIPYTVNKTSLLEKIAELVKDKKITGISDLRDESDKDGMRIVVELKKGEIPQVIINQLLKHTALERTFGATLVALDHNHPKLMNLTDILSCYIAHRKEVVVRRTKFELKNAENRAHILEGFRIALQNLDAVVRIIRESKDRETARTQLMASFEFTVKQANSILDMRLYQLTGLEQNKIEEEYTKLLEKIAEYRSILSDDVKVFSIIKTELDEVVEKYGDTRKTQIEMIDSEIDMEDLIPDEKVIITVSHEGYVKRVPLDTYKQQKRGGKGVIGLDMKDEDFVEHLFVANAHDYILFFTTAGKVYWLKVYNIPAAGRLSRGKSIVNLIQISSEEKIAAMIRVREFTKEKAVVMSTQKGILKKTNLNAYSNPRKAGIIAINIDEDDSLINVALVEKGNDIILVTKNGLSIRFKEDQAREIGRVARGVKGITLKGDDAVVDMSIIKNDDDTLLIATENGYGKRTPFSHYRAQGRGGKGIITVKTSERNGNVIGAMRIGDSDEIMMITAEGKTVRTACGGISVVGRNTQGVRIISLGKTDKLSSIAKIAKDADDSDDTDAELDQDINAADQQNMTENVSVDTEIGDSTINE